MQSASAIVFRFTFSGTTYYAAIRTGISGWVLLAHGTVPEDVVNTAFTTLGAGARIVLLDATYPLAAAGISFTANEQVLEGQGRGTFIDGDALATGVHAINLIGFDDCEIRNLAIKTESGVGKFCYCIFIEDGADNFKIIDITIIDSADDGIRIVGTTITQGHIIRLHIETIGDGGVGAGIYVSMDAANFLYRLHIKDCDILNCSDTGITFVGTGQQFYCQIVNNIISGCGYGINIHNSDYSLIQGNICLDNGSEGIRLFSTNHAQVSDNLCQGNGGNGILMSTNDDIVISGNNCPGNTLNGILLSNSPNCTVSFNLCQGNTESGIDLNLSNSTAASGNACRENGEHGIFMNSSDFCTLTGNICAGNDSGDTGTFDGIFIRDSQRNIVLGNHCKDNDRWGIMVDIASDNNKISNNYTEGNTAGSIRVNNANCDNNTIEFNTVEEGAPGNVGTNTRSYGNYDPSANAFVGDVGAAPW